MPELKISIIIPTYNRADILRKSLACYENQTLPAPDFEILLIDDGSSDHTLQVVDEIKKNYPIALQFLKQNHKGANAARNLGIKNSKGKLLLFTGDDILPLSNFLEEHWNRHLKSRMDERVAVLGLTEWSPDIKVTPLMKYLEVCDYLPQFEYNRIDNPESLAHEFFYTSNITVHREFLLKYGVFDEEMNKPFADDGELAYRLKKKDLRIVYQPNAKAYHWHEIRLHNLYKRAQTAGEMCYLFWKKHPELGKFPDAKLKPRIKLWLKSFTLVRDRLLLENAEKHNQPFTGNPIVEQAYRKVLMNCYQRGVQEGIRLYGSSNY
jgi:glycosyltransferase involved in cell wall biosynthesis